MAVSWTHRYLMTRLSSQVVYLWRHVSSTALPLLFGPLHRSSPFVGELRCQAIQTEHGPYIAERTQKAVYIVRCLWLNLISFCSPLALLLLCPVSHKGVLCVLIWLAILPAVFCLKTDEVLVSLSALGLLYGPAVRPGPAYTKAAQTMAVSSLF
jgi:hypothetical protein